MTQRSPKEIAEEIYGMDLKGRKASVVAAIAEAIEKAVLEEREGCIQAVLGLDGDVFVIERAVETIRQRGERK